MTRDPSGSSSSFIALHLVIVLDRVITVEVPLYRRVERHRVRQNLPWPTWLELSVMDRFNGPHGSQPVAEITERSRIPRRLVDCVGCLVLWKSC